MLSLGTGIEKKAKLAELMKEVEFLKNKRLAERLMIEEKLTKSSSSQLHKGIQNKISGAEVTPKQRAKERTLAKADQPREKLNYLQSQANADTSSSKCPPLEP